MIPIFRRWREWRLKRALASLEVSPEQWQQVEACLPLLGHLAAEDRQRLRKMALQFLSEKEMCGAQGLELNADMQLAIALQACLPVLNLGLEWYRGWIGIVVYPGDFVISRNVEDEFGIVHQYDDPVAGEAWEGGPVVLSWGNESASECHGEDMGYDEINVVIHEFAHKLDMLNGVPNGLPPLHQEMSRNAWLGAFDDAFADFAGRVENGEDTALDPYAADNPSEFFAVMSESFFEMPLLLQQEYPAVYEQLRLFYRQDPAAGATVNSPSPLTPLPREGEGNPSA